MVLKPRPGLTILDVEMKFDLYKKLTPLCIKFAELQERTVLQVRITIVEYLLDSACGRDCSAVETHLAEIRQRQRVNSDDQARVTGWSQCTQVGTLLGRVHNHRTVLSHPHAQTSVTPSLSTHKYTIIMSFDCTLTNVTLCKP